MLLEVQWENVTQHGYSYIQFCCFLARIYVGVHLFGCQNKSTCFQKFKSSKLMFSMRVRSK